MHKMRKLYAYEFRRMWWALIVGAGLLLMLLPYMWTFVIDVTHTWSYATRYSVSYCYPEELYRTGEVAGSQFSYLLLQLLGGGVKAVLLIFGVLTFIMFRQDHKKRQEEYFMTLPYTESQRFSARIVVGSTIISAVCLCFSGMVLLIRSIVIDKIYEIEILSPYYKELIGNESIVFTLRTLLQFWLTLIAVYLVLVMFHCFVSNGILASLFGIGAILFPQIVVMRVEEWIPVKMYESLFSYAGFLTGNNFYKDIVYVGEDDAEAYGEIPKYIIYHNSWYVFSLLIGAIVLTLCIAFLSRKKRDMAKQTCLVPNHLMRYALSIMVGIGLGMILEMIVSYFFMVEYSENPQMISMYIWGVCSLVLAFVANKVFKKQVQSV